MLKFLSVIGLFLAAGACDHPDKNTSTSQLSERLNFSDVSDLFPNLDETCQSVECLIGTSYASDTIAKNSAYRLYNKFGIVAGTGSAQTIQVTQGSDAQLMPEMPIGPYREKIFWTLYAFDWIAGVMHEIQSNAKHSVNYQWKTLSIGYMRSVNGARPSGWVQAEQTSMKPRIFINLSGSLNQNPQLMRNMIIHEVFHWNDHQHKGWSKSSIRNSWQAVVDLCGNDTICLRPFTPTTMRLNGDRYYAFNMDHGDPIAEFAAEVAVRYFLDQKAMIDNGIVENPWKCRTKINLDVWTSMIREFFGGFDLLPQCL